MIQKFNSLQEGINMLKALDDELEPRLRLDNLSDKEYKAILSKLKKRSVIINEMKRIEQEGNKPKAAQIEEIKQIFDKNKEIIKHIGEKQRKILKRLKSREKTLKKNQNFPY